MHSEHERSPSSRAPAGRSAIDRQLGTWIRILAVVVLGWLIIEKIAIYVAHIAFAASIFIGGMFVAYLIYPAVKWLNNHLPLWAAIAVMYAAFALAAGATLWFVVPIAIADLNSFAADAPQLFERARDYLGNPKVLAHLPQPIRPQIAQLPDMVATYALHNAHLLTDNVVPALLSAVTLVALFIAIPVVAAYMIYEAAPIEAYILAALPYDRRASVASIIRQLDDVVGGFVRGQVLVAITIGVMTAGLLLVLRVPYAILIGLWAGVLELIPYLGAAAGAIPGVGIALLVNGIGDAAAASLGFAIMYQLEGNFISPRIVARTMRISPLVVLFAVVAGGEAFGFIGLLVAVPIAGIIRVVLENVQALHRDPVLLVSDPARELSASR